MLVSEDLYYRATAEIATGGRGVWLQAVFMFAVEAGLIGPDRYDDLTVGLALRRHGHVAIDARSLVRAMREDGDAETWRFDALAEFIGTADAEVTSHVRVVQDFLHEAWPRSGDASLAVMRSSGTLIGKLLRYQPDHVDALLAALRITTGASLKRYLDHWIKGHFLSLDKVVAMEVKMRSAVRERSGGRPSGALTHEGKRRRPSKGKRHR